MAFGIRKPGQGYWVRVLSAVFWGGLVLAAAGWAGAQAGTIPLPIKSYVVFLQATDGELAVGDGVTLFREGATPEAGDTELLSAAVDSFQPGANRNATVEISGFTGDADLVSDAEEIRSGVDGTGFTATISNVDAVPAISQTYVQGGAAGLVILLGAVFLYWFHAVGRKSTEFLIATDNEMKKVNWSSPREIRGSTIVVIVATFLIAGILYVIDIAFSSFFNWVGVLEV